MKWRIAAIVYMVGSSALTSFGEIVYDNILPGTDGIAWIGDSVIDDLMVEGGGLLQSVTIALTASGGGESVLTELTILIAVDGGDGIPDVFGNGDDSFLFQVEQSGVEVAVGGVTEVTVDVSEFYPLVPEDALLFGGLMLSNSAVGHLFYATPTVGSTDGLVFSLFNGGPAPVPGAADPDLHNSMGLAFRLDVVQLPDNPNGPEVTGDPIDFESLEEDQYDTTLAVDAITFSDGRSGFPPIIDAIFAIDDGTGVWQANEGMLDFIGGKLLQVNAISVGPEGFVFVNTKSMKMSLDALYTGVRMSIAYVVESDGFDFSSSKITLLALLGEEMVASTFIHPDTVLGESSGGSFTFGAGIIELSGVAFDSLVLFNNGPGPFGTVRVALDNIILQENTCPTDLTGDGVVGPQDLAQLLGNWGPNPGHPADFDGDGLIGPADLAQLLGTWGPCA